MAQIRKTIRPDASQPGLQIFRASPFEYEQTGQNAEQVKTTIPVGIVCTRSELIPPVTVFTLLPKPLASTMGRQKRV